MVRSLENMTCWIHRKEWWDYTGGDMITIVKYVKDCRKQKNNRLHCISIADRVSSKGDLGRKEIWV